MVDLNEIISDIEKPLQGNYKGLIVVFETQRAFSRR